MGLNVRVLRYKSSKEMRTWSHSNLRRSRNDFPKAKYTPFHIHMNIRVHSVDGPRVYERHCSVSGSG